MNIRKVLAMSALVVGMVAPCVHASEFSEMKTDIKEIKEVVLRMDDRQFNFNGDVKMLEARMTGQASATAVIVTAIFLLGGRCLSRRRCKA